MSDQQPSHATQPADHHAAHPTQPADHHAAHHQDDATATSRDEHPTQPSAYHDVHPPSARWTHVALRVRDIDATIDWYTSHTPLKLLDRRTDDNGYGAWLGHDDSPDKPFILVVAQFFEESDPFGNTPIATLAPFAHLGVELTSREELEAAAARAETEGCLAVPPTQMPPPIGYICMLSDPDGNMVELSYDQGVYAHARKVMR